MKKVNKDYNKEMEIIKLKDLWSIKGSGSIQSTYVYYHGFYSKEQLTVRDITAKNEYVLLVTKPSTRFTRFGDEIVHRYYWGDNTIMAFPLYPDEFWKLIDEAHWDIVCQSLSLAHGDEFELEVHGYDNLTACLLVYRGFLNRKEKYIYRTHLLHYNPLNTFIRL